MDKRLCPALDTGTIVAEIDERFTPPTICIFESKAGKAIWLTEDEAKSVYEWLGRALSASGGQA